MHSHKVFDENLPLQTIGGSLATASSSADINALLLAAGSRVKIASTGKFPVGICISVVFEFKICIGLGICQLPKSNTEHAIVHVM